MKYLFILTFYLNGFLLFSFETNREFAIEPEVKCIKDQNPRLEIKWNKDQSSIYQVIGRFSEETQEWDSLAILDNNADFYIDSTIVVGKKYEYFIRRYFWDRIAYSYFSSGIEVPFEQDKGRVLLLIDKTITEKLKPEISTFIDDLQEDGWTIDRYDVDRTDSFNTNAVHKIKSYCMLEYYRYRNNFKSVILLGRIAVPYSGNYSIDGHLDYHFGAFPSDVYYQTFEGSWTDSVINTITPKGRPQNWNVPFDGKFDDNVIPSDARFGLGRIDFFNLPVFSDLTEIDLLRRYLNKDHLYRQNKLNYQYKGLIDDKFKFYLNEFWGSSAWINFSALLNSKNVDSSSLTMPMISDSNYLFYYGCAGGDWDLCGNTISSDYASKNKINSVFINLFGSYFIDWDSKNNLMRSVLAADGNSLTLNWNGRPYLWFHYMGIGETVGYSILQSQNYQPKYPTYCKWGFRQNHISLLGDPTLTIHNVKIPSEANIKHLYNFGDKKTLQLKWEPPYDETEIIGYNIYKYDFLSKKYIYINFCNNTTFTYLDTVDQNTKNKYLVKTLKLVTSNTASFYKESQGLKFEGTNFNEVIDTNDLKVEDLYLNGDLSKLEKELNNLQLLEEICVYKYNGTEIAKFKNIDDLIIKLNDLKVGIYFLKIKANSKSYVKKILMIYL